LLSRRLKLKPEVSLAGGVCQNSHSGGRGTKPNDTETAMAKTNDPVWEGGQVKNKSWESNTQNNESPELGLKRRGKIAVCQTDKSSGTTFGTET